MFHREEWTACHDLHTGFFTAFEDGIYRVALHNHGTDENVISPLEVLFGKVCHIEIDQSLFPFRRQHCCNGQQTQWRCAGPLVNEFQCVFKTPKGIRELRINKQDLQCCLLFYSSFTNLTPLPFPFPAAIFTGRLPSNSVGLIPCSVITTFALSRREFSTISSFFKAWALPTKYFSAASLTNRIASALPCAT